MLTGLNRTKQLAGLVVGRAGATATSSRVTSRSISTTTIESQREKNDNQNAKSTSATTEQAAETSQSVTQPATRAQGAVELHEERPSRPLFYHEQMEWLDERLVRISKPTKNVMQSGTASTNCWKIEFDSQPRSEYWLIGWTGTSDPMSNMTMTFPDKESAINYCERNKLQWFLEEQSERKIRRKSYADNFSWNKRTRLGSK